MGSSGKWYDDIFNELEYPMHKTVDMNGRYTVQPPKDSKWHLEPAPKLNPFVNEELEQLKEMLYMRSLVGNMIHVKPRVIRRD